MTIGAAAAETRAETDGQTDTLCLRCRQNSTVPRPGRCVSFVRFAADRATVILVQFHVVARRLNRGVTRLISAAVMSAAREHINNTAAAAAKCFQETAMPSRLVPPPAAVLLLLRRGPRHLRGHDFGRGRIKRSISPPVRRRRLGGSAMEYISVWVGCRGGLCSSLPGGSHSFVAINERD